MKKAVYNSKKERTKRRRKLEEKTRKEILGRKFQEENFRKKIAGRKFQEENCKGDRKRMDMDFFDLSFEESLDEQLVNASLDVGRDIRRLFEGKESLFSMLDRMKEDWQQRFRAVPESAIASGDSSLQKERNKISETSSDGK